MKRIIIAFLPVFWVVSLFAQGGEIIGSWTMFKMIWIQGENIDKTTQDQMKDQGLSTEYSFMADGKFKLKSNMNMKGSVNMETMEGTWKLEADKLTCSFLMNGNSVDILWDIEFEDGVIHMKRTFPDGSTSVVNSFKRK